MKNLPRFLALSHFCIISFCCFSPSVLAAPDAGVLQQQMDRDRTINLPQRNSPIEAEPKPMGAIKGQAITVKAFHFRGNTLLSSESLNLVVATYVGRALTFSELQQAVMAVAKSYRESGWIVRVYLPEQDVNDGNITIQIVEAVFGGVKIEGSTGRVGEDRVLRMVDVAQNKGELVNAEKLDRAVLLIDDLPGAIVVGSLKKGEGENETDLHLKMSDEPFIVGNLNADNNGSHATGSGRINGNLYLNSPLGLGDQAVVNLIHSDGTDYARLAYSFPVGDNGMRLGASGSYSSYDLVANEYKSLDAKGSFFTIGLDASYPLIRARSKNLYVDFNFEHKNFDNQVGLATTSKYFVNNFGLGLSGNIFDRFNGVNLFGVKLIRGDLTLGELNTSEDQSLDGSFTKLSYNISRQQLITESISLFVGLNGQLATTNLDSSEKFYLGGANGVRAYPVNEAGGKEGQILNLEVRKQFPGNFSLAGFYDVGRVQVGQVNGIPSNDITLKGVGLAFSWKTDFGLNLKAIWARRIGDNPNPTASGSDQDGTLHKDRFWLSVAMPF